ncbi:unnamed protein product [Caenorhabditis sp. 36 PRJEB53466]|nr:unnamed protein product [Caenorhabditis sp. 36 PRJEB53466]
MIRGKSPSKRWIRENTEPINQLIYFKLCEQRKGERYGFTPSGVVEWTGNRKPKVFCIKGLCTGFFEKDAKIALKMMPCQPNGSY